MPGTYQAIATRRDALVKAVPGLPNWIEKKEQQNRPKQRQVPRDIAERKKPAEPTVFRADEHFCLAALWIEIWERLRRRRLVHWKKLQPVEDIQPTHHFQSADAKRAFAVVKHRDRL